MNGNYMLLHTQTICSDPISNFSNSTTAFIGPFFKTVPKMNSLAYIDGKMTIRMLFSKEDMQFM